MISSQKTQNFQLILEEYLNAKGTLSKSTINSYAAQIRHFAKECELMNTSIFEATEGHIASYLSDYSFYKTKTSYKTILNAFYKWTMKKGYVSNNPTEDIVIKSGKKTKKDPLREIDYKQILGRCQNLRELTIVSFLWYTGVRAKELRGMKLDDANLKRNTIFVSDSKTLSGYRTIPIHPNFRKLLQKYNNRRRDLSTSEPYLFLTLHGKKIGERTLIAIVKNLQKDWNGPFTCHDFRRAFVTRLYKKTNDIVLCQKLAGHADIATTRKYILDDPEEHAAKFNSLNF